MKYRKWEGDDLENIVNRSIDELVIIYPDVARNTLFTLQRYHQKIGTKVERQEPYIDAKDEKEKADRRRGVSKTAGGAAMKGMVSIFVKEEHKDYHEQFERHLDEFGTVSKARFSEYQMGMKNADGEFEAHDLKAVRFEVKFDSEPKWVPVNRVESVKLAKKERLNPSALPKTDIIADLQWPFVDYKALEVATKILIDRQPDNLIIGGDLMDLSAWSKYQQMPEWATITQQSVNEVHQFLASLRKSLPRTRIIVVEGNHEKRVPDLLLNNAKAAYGLKRADQPENWPVLSIPYLTAMDTLDIEYHDGFPANTLWLTPNLQFKHRPKGKTPTAVVGNERYSTVYGDNHRVESAYRTIPTMEGGLTYGVFGVGALCRLDGHTPGVNSGRHLDGTPVKAFNDNWQQGIMLIDHHEDGSFNANQIFIDTFNGYKAIYNGKVYQPNDI